MILATRGSALAMAQAAIVKKKLEDAGEHVTILPVKTKGDRDRRRPLTEIGGDGLFIRELEKVLLSGEADLAVHSAKDLPYQLADGLSIAGVPEAADPRDCLFRRPRIPGTVCSRGAALRIPGQIMVRAPYALVPAVPGASYSTEIWIPPRSSRGSGGTSIRGSGS